ncbi:MAG: CinA family protein [Anaerolineales bacterium]|nr:CinA family protein [Anaerolineales bacterium]
MTSDLESEIGRLLTERRLTLATAESCTGGLVGHRLTNVPGSSAYFLGGIIAYSNDAKERLLGVRRETLSEHGAVSEATVREMACGVRHTLGADIGLAVTGIAGPGGGLPDKPVGLVWLALSARDAEIVRRFVWDGDRLNNKERSAEAALELVRDYLLGHVA